MKVIVALLISLFLLASCGGGSESTSQPVARLATIELLTVGTAIRGEKIMLSAAKSEGDGTLSFQWVLTSKPDSSQLSSLNGSSQEFEFVADVSGSYKVKLTVTDRSGSSSVEKTIDVAQNQVPILKVELPSDVPSIVVGESIRFDARLSQDPEQRALSYQWGVIEQPASSNLQDTTADYYDFTPQVRGTYRLRLSISDGVNETSEIIAYRAVASSILLKPQSDSALSATSQVEAVFGLGSVELPVTHDAPHLTIENDNEVGDHFVFTLHLEEDGDRDIPLAQTDRQRSEIKTYSLSDQQLTCQQGESMSLYWRFKAQDIGLTYSFTHLFQMKGIGDHPLLTFTARRVSNNKNSLRILHGEQDAILGELDWEQIKERWIQSTVEFSCQEKGFLTITLTDLDTNEVLLSLEKQELDMWANDSEQLGFKFGFYRRVKQNASDTTFREGLNSLIDEVRFSDIRIETW